MKLSELKEWVDRSLHGRNDDNEVVIAIEKPYATVGGSPVVAVKSAQNGFDWDKGKFLIFTEEPLTNHDVDFEGKFKKMQDDYGWSEYEKGGLKTEIKRLRKRIKELEGIK